MNDGPCRRLKHDEIQTGIGRIDGAAQLLEDLLGEIQGHIVSPKVPTSPKAILCLASTLQELPAQIAEIDSRIRKSIEELRGILF